MIQLDSDRKSSSKNSPEDAINVKVLSVFRLRGAETTVGDTVQVSRKQAERLTKNRLAELA